MFAAKSTIVFAIVSEAVAAGEGRSARAGLCRRGRTGSPRPGAVGLEGLGAGAAASGNEVGRGDLGEEALEGLEVVSPIPVIRLGFLPYPSICPC